MGIGSQTFNRRQLRDELAWFNQPPAICWVCGSPFNDDFPGILARDDGGFYVHKTTICYDYFLESLIDRNRSKRGRQRRPHEIRRLCYLAIFFLFVDGWRGQDGIFTKGENKR